MDAQTIIVTLVGLIQVGFLFVFTRIFSTQDKLFSVVETNRKSCVEKIEKNADETKSDIKSLKKEHEELLDNHYVTTGQLTTLEEKLVGQMQKLGLSIEHLTLAIKEKM